MATSRSRSLRVEDDLEAENARSTEEGQSSVSADKINCRKMLDKNVVVKSLGNRKLSRVFPEDYNVVQTIVLDPRGHFVQRWNKIFFAACLTSLFVDPLFFYLPAVKKDICIDITVSLKVFLTIIRSLVEAFYIVQIILRFRTAYIAPSSRVFGRGELVIDPSKIASRYLHKGFWLDLLAAQPVPQVLVWAAIQNLKEPEVFAMRYIFPLLTNFQYIVRLYLISHLKCHILKANGVVLERAWAGAAYNLILYMLASHVLGSCWYLLSVSRLVECWKKACRLQYPECQQHFLFCDSVKDPNRYIRFNKSDISRLCTHNSNFFQFGIFSDALTSEITSSSFFRKYYYCLWWGLRNLSSLGQNLVTSTYIAEIIFTIIIAILGLVLFALLIGNMQMYLQSTTKRLEDWRIRRSDTERWMHHRQLPRQLKQNVRSFDQFRWAATRGVNEESILKSLSPDLRRDIKRHLCLGIVRQVPLFDQMDERVLDAICERLQPSLCTPGTCLVREGDLVNEMFFIIRGRLDSYTTRFFNSCQIGPADFCGEELLTWALDPRPNVILPSSTRTVKAITEVEAFALIADDLKFVASQFWRLHSKQLRHALRFHSHQWRTWAACFIQAAWIRYKRRKEALELEKKEILMHDSDKEPKNAPLQRPTGSSFVAYAAKLAASARRG